jgi:glycine/D-amino acid oxidase-like deaminating enzyme
MNNQYNYIIVGQGIAGTALAYTMIKKGLSVLVIDEKTLSMCSKVAAGNFNPIVFKRLIKSWMADELIAFSDIFYKDAEQILGQYFYTKKEIVRIFGEEQEQAFWLKKSQNDDEGKYLSKTIITDFFTDIVNNPLGCAFVNNGCNLYVAKFLEDFRNYFIQHQQLLDEVFDYSQLQINEDFVTYKNNTAKKIIFCEGYKVAENPYFNWLPLKPAKGETLTVKIKNLYTDKIINKGVYILPIGDDLFIVGATYDWENLNDDITEKGRAEIAEKLAKVINVPFEIVKQEAGVRPSMIDRRPVIGLHPQHRTMGVFNGMGTKGVMLAPFFAKQFVDHLEHHLELNKEVDIARFIYNS